MVKKEFSIKDIRTLKNLNKDKLDFYIDYLNKVEIKLKANGDIDYIKTGYYRDYTMYTQTSYYLLTYEYGPDVTMPYGIDEEL